MEKSVTYVPGLNCYLCSRTFNSLRSLGLLDVLHEYACGGLSTAGFQPAAAGTAAVRVPVETPRQAGAFAA